MCMCGLGVFFVVCVLVVIFVYVWDVWVLGCWFVLVLGGLGNCWFGLVVWWLFCCLRGVVVFGSWKFWSRWWRGVGWVCCVCWVVVCVFGLLGFFVCLLWVGGCFNGMSENFVRVVRGWVFFWFKFCFNLFCWWFEMDLLICLFWSLKLCWGV